MSGSNLVFPVIIWNNLTGPGDPSAYSCWASYTDWRTAPASTTVFTIPSSTIYSRWTDPAPTITVNPCDGITRRSGVDSTYIIVTYTNITSLSTSYSYLPKPPCTITKQDQCSTMYDVYTSYSNSWTSSWWSSRNAANSTKVPVLSIGALTPPCTRDSDVKSRECPASYSTAKSIECRISASHPTVFYWPTKADICQSNNIAVTGAPDQTPRTAVYKGATITSPTALLVMNNVRAQSFSVDGTYIPSPQSCAFEYGDHTMLAAPSDMSTVTWMTRWVPRYSPYTNISTPMSTASPKPFNFADLNSVPWENYLNYKSCWNGWPEETFDSKVCPRTIYDDYNPILYLPTALKSLSGMPTNCRLENTFFWPATYVPITSDTVAAPTSTVWGVNANDPGMRPTPNGGTRAKRDIPIETGKAN